MKSIIFLIVLSIVVIHTTILRNKVWIRLGTMLFPLILVANIIYNFYSFDQINKSKEWHLQRLPSNELIDLIEMMPTPIKTRWIYPLIGEFYPGRTLSIPLKLLDSLDLSLELLQSQGRLAYVKTIEHDKKLTEHEVEMFLRMKYVELYFVNGETYHFITEEMGPNSPLLILKHESQIFIIPEDLLLESEVNP